MNTLTSTEAAQVNGMCPVASAVTLGGRLMAIEGAQRCGVDYFVDANRTVDTGDGLSWATAFQKLATALAASHANIALTANRNWAGRNRIFLKADSTTEDLVLLADKTDVIGVGSKDSYSMPCIIGNHVPVHTEPYCMGTRFFNVQFRGAVADGGIIWTLASTVSGIQFHGCHFNGWSTIPATIGLKATASPRLEVHNCKFNGAFSTAAIHLLTGEANGTLIKDNLINSAGIGIDVDSGFTCANEQAFVIGNRIKATGLVIDDDSDTMVYMDNVCISGGAFGDTSHDIPATLSVNNVVTGSDKTGLVPSTDQEY